MRNKWIWSAIAAWLLIVLLTGQPAGAGPYLPEPTPTPPKPTWTPGAPPLKTPTPGPTFGSTLELQITGTAVVLNYWTVVQWQNENRAWYDVEGWRGTLDDLQSGVGLKDWWVDKGNFGEGPFRWQVYRSFGGAWLANSDSFDLPTSSRQPVVVVVTIP